MTLIKTMIIALSFLVAAKVYASVGTDISGVKIGMAASDVRRAIESINGAYKLKVFKSPDGGVFGVTAVEMKSGVPVDNFQAINDESGKVWFIGRAQVIETGKRFSSEQLLSSLIQKYGQSSINDISKSGGVIRWHTDRSGNLFKGKISDSPCLIHGGNKKESQSYGPSVIGTAVKVPLIFNPKCDNAIEVDYLIDSKNNLVERWSIRAFNAAVMSDAISREKDAIRQKQDTAINPEKAANNKPNL